MFLFLFISSSVSIWTYAVVAVTLERTFAAIVLSVTQPAIVGQQESSFFKKPWPTYSLQNMPQTRFTCHDKILGGYYADPETQCQMFHVCVKVGGVGVSTDLNLDEQTN